jgi:endonuclease/exonuclease/phosphatase family metal-dependent hydrolase
MVINTQHYFMQLLSLNAWGCKRAELFDFVRENAGAVDIFCFQELLRGGNGITDKGELKNGFERMSEILYEYTGYFSEYGDGGYFSMPSSSLDFQYGIACFIHNQHSHSLVSSTRLYDPTREWADYDGEFAAGLVQVLEVAGCTIINVHGLWQGGIKTDTSAKIEQSERIVELAGGFHGKVVIAGDFNIEPDTVSVRLLRDRYRDLVEDYAIENTRSPLYKKGIGHADYMFVSPDVAVEDFMVPEVSISDHLPLVLTLKINDRLSI